MDINKDKIKVKKKTANAKKNNRSVSEAKKSVQKTPKTKVNVKQKPPPQVEPDSPPVKEEVFKSPEQDYFDKMLESLQKMGDEHETSFKDLVTQCQELLNRQISKVAHIKPDSENQNIIEGVSRCINSILPKISQVECQLEAEIQAKLDAHKEVDNQRAMNERLKKLYEEASTQKLSEEFEGEIPQDDYVKMFRKLEGAMLKQAELQYEIDKLINQNAAKDQILNGCDIPDLILKVDKMICTFEHRSLSIVQPKPTIPSISNSLQTQSLPSKIKTLSSQLDITQQVLIGSDLTQELKQKLQKLKSDNVDAGVDTQVKLLSTEKSQLESDLKDNKKNIAHMEQLVNSLSEVIMFKNRHKKKPHNAAFVTPPNQRSGAPIDDETDNQSFAQYDIESADNSAVPVTLSNPSSHRIPSIQNSAEIDSLKEIIAMKNALFDVQQEELDRIKNEITQGTGVYVFMHQAELEEWKKYRAIDTTFTLVDKLRNAVPKNVKWIDKNVHKVIRNILELKDKEMQVCSLDNQFAIETKKKQIWLDKILRELVEYVKVNKSLPEDMKDKGCEIFNKYSSIIGLLNDSCVNSMRYYHKNFQTLEQLIKTQVRNAQLEDELVRNKPSEISNNEEILILKSKNSKLYQEISLLHKLLKSKGLQGQEYLAYAQDTLLKENEALKTQISKMVPYNEDLAQSLSFYKIQYHLLKKKFSNISTVLQSKSTKSLEEALRLTQKQLIESEAQQHYSMGGADEDILIEEICECKMDIRHLNESVKELTSSNDKLKKKIELSKNVLTNYEATIEKLHRELELAKIINKNPIVGTNDQQAERGLSQQTSRSKSRHKTGIVANEIQKLLDDIQVLSESVRDQANEIATLKFENDKIYNLYQNKEKLLNDKRNEIAQIHSTYEELAEEVALHNEYMPNQFSLLELVKIHQKEREEYRKRIRDVQKELVAKKIDYFVMEEKDQIWKREREFFIQKQALYETELEHSKQLVFRMENHINSLSVMLIPPEDIQRISDFKTDNDIDGVCDSDSDSSYDDMLKDYGAASASKNAMSKQNNGANHGDPTTPYLNNSKLTTLILQHPPSYKTIRKSWILKNQNDILQKERKIDQQVIKWLVKQVASNFDLYCGDQRSNKLIQNLTNIEIDEKQKLQLLEHLAGSKHKMKNTAEGEIALLRSDAITQELEELTMQVEKFQIGAKIKDQQIQTLAKVALKSIVDGSVEHQKPNLAKYLKMDKNDLAQELFKVKKMNFELDKINTQLQKRLRQQSEIYDDLNKQDLSKTVNLHAISSTKSGIVVNQMQDYEISEAWSMVDRIGSHNWILMNTNKELMDELNAYKAFFSSKYDTLERESSSSYQMLLSLRQETDILTHKIQKLQLENEYLTTSLKEHSDSERRLSDQKSEATADPNTTPLKTDPNISVLKDQLVQANIKNADLLQNYEVIKSQSHHIKKRNNYLWMTAQTQLDVQFDLKTQIIKLKEQNTKLTIKTALGPELLQKLGHKQDNIPSFATADEVANDIFEQHMSTVLTQNKDLETDLKQVRAEREGAKERAHDLDMELKGLKTAYQVLKGSIKSTSQKSSSSNESTLLSKIKARDVELSILKNEREEMYNLKEKLVEARKAIMAKDMSVAELNDPNPMKNYKNLLLDMHQKYTSHLTDLIDEISCLNKQLKKSSETAFRSQ